ncbi:MAG TPA: cysteine desulfurase-like protein [Gemmataceae bacterium]|jgi:cysteine desulfurase family protein (TIGR01976 family)|nr:cysteine desulfurase-like protein [Gemmataceae bacterium]
MTSRIPGDLAAIRRQFPALNQIRKGRKAIFLDGPGGTQTPQVVIDAMVHYLQTCNANHGGVFATSHESDRILELAHQSMADFLNAPSANEIVFGANMTTLTFHLSRALANAWKPGDEIVVTRLDHDANVSPWVLAARDAQVRVHYVDVRIPDCTVDLEQFRTLITNRTRLVAVGCASNAVGTVNDVAAIGKIARAHGALIFLDAVHFGPHGPIDVQAWDCDFLACSAYKFFGPHVGVLWGRTPLLERLQPYKVRPATDSLPGRWMTGTQCHEGIAGTAAAVRYLAELAPATDPQAGTPAFRARLRQAMQGIQRYEQGLVAKLLRGLADMPRYEVWGIRDLTRLDERAPTVGISFPGRNAVELATFLAERSIYAWNGNMYALNLSERLGLESRGGFLRLGMVHYNTEAEVDETLQVLADFLEQSA